MESNAIHTPLVGHGLVIVTAGYPVKKVIALRPGAVAGDKRVATVGLGVTPGGGHPEEPASP